VEHLTEQQMERSTFEHKKQTERGTLLFQLRHLLKQELMNQLRYLLIQIIDITLDTVEGKMEVDGRQYSTHTVIMVEQVGLQITHLHS
jgi:hypothetical protein